MRVQIGLKCEECGTRNYYTKKEKSKKDKLRLKKYCPRCNKHTFHTETKV